LTKGIIDNGITLDNIQSVKDQLSITMNGQMVDFEFVEIAGKTGLKTYGSSVLTQGLIVGKSINPTKYLLDDEPYENHIWNNTEYGLISRKNSHTFSCWFYGFIGNIGMYGSHIFEYVDLQINRGMVRWYAQTTGTNDYYRNYIFDTSGIRSDQWNHYVVSIEVDDTRTQWRINVYINGQLAQPLDIGSSWEVGINIDNTTFHPYPILDIHGHANRTDRHINIATRAHTYGMSGGPAYLRKIAFYDRLLTAEEIADLYTNDN
jgi:hypothetical protein